MILFSTKNGEGVMVEGTDCKKTEYTKETIEIACNLRPGISRLMNKMDLSKKQIVNLALLRFVEGHK